MKVLKYIFILLFFTDCNERNEQKVLIKDSIRSTQVSKNTCTNGCIICTTIDSALVCKEKVKGLYMKNYYHDSLPNSILTLYNLTEFEIQNSNIKVDFLFDKLSKIKSIMEITIYDSNIKSIPNNINLFTSLEKLTCSDSALSKIAPDIIIPRSLQYLNIGRNLKKIKFNESYDKIQFLDLSFNQSLKSIDKSIKFLENLREINLSNTSISQLPEEFKYLKKIEKIMLADTPLAKEELHNIKNTNNYVKLLFIKQNNSNCKIYLHHISEYR